MSRPLLFLDVDGPLNPYAAQAERRPEGYTTIRVPFGSRTLRVWLNPDHGPALLALGYDLCWATTWMAEAGSRIAPVIGLPTDLPYVDFGTGLFAVRPDAVHWKTEAIVAYADGRPFAWVDDEQSPADTRYVRDRHPGPALLHPVDPRIGLRADDFAALRRFAAALPA